jgi:hypothetical protein
VNVGAEQGFVDLGRRLSLAAGLPARGVAEDAHPESLDTGRPSGWEQSATVESFIPETIINGYAAVAVAA